MHLPKSEDSPYAIAPLWRVQTPGPGGKAFLDIQNDVTVDDVHLALREGTVAGVPARVVRISFTGELSFEINVAPRHLRDLWDQVMSVGAEFGTEPVGSEANHVLRVEKGFLSLGLEVDGTVDAYDLGMGWVMSKTKADYLGKRAVDLRRAGGTPRRELVSRTLDGFEIAVDQSFGDFCCRLFAPRLCLRPVGLTMRRSVHRRKNQPHRRRWSPQARSATG